MINVIDINSQYQYALLEINGVDLEISLAAGLDLDKFQALLDAFIAKAESFEFVPEREASSAYEGLRFMGENGWVVPVLV